MALWRDPMAFREERGSFRAWLMATVHHRAVDAVRREEAQRRRSQEWEPETAVQDIGQTVAGFDIFTFNKGCVNCHTQVHGSNHPAGKALAR